jgi:hypothetical protein
MENEKRTFARVGLLMLLEAVALAIAAALHLTGHVEGRGAPFDAHDAGIAEAIIAVVLLGGGVALLRVTRRARTLGIAANVFAIVGFGVGLSITARGGHAPDITFHLVILPLLITSLIVLARTRRSARPVDLVQSLS